MLLGVHSILNVIILASLGLCPDWETWDPKKPVDNAREAMQQADDWLGVPQVWRREMPFELQHIQVAGYEQK